MFTSFRMTRFRLLFLLPMVFLFFASASASAQPIDVPYDEGLVTFDYAQYPWGSLNGTFLASGLVCDENLEFPEGQTSGCGGGLRGSVGETTDSMAIGLINNPNGSQDVTAVFVSFPDGPAMGNYPVDTENGTVGFLWIDDATNLTLPEEGADYQLWFDNLEAAHKFGSISGSINVTTVGSNSFSGTFSGLMGDPNDNTVLSVTNGQFELFNTQVAATPEVNSLVALTVAPNPFNPQTTIKLSVEKAGPVVVNVFDLAGHQIAVLHNGQLAEGDYQWVWSGRNSHGVQQSGGVYFCRAVGNGWADSIKMVLVP